MGYSKEKLDTIFARTDRRCHICGKGLCRKNYARPGARGAWEVEHSKPRAREGTDHGNNLYAAHIRCNREKGTLSTRSIPGRSRNGKTGSDGTLIPTRRSPRGSASRGATQG